MLLEPFFQDELFTVAAKQKVLASDHYFCLKKKGRSKSFSKLFSDLRSSGHLSYVVYFFLFF